MVGPGFDIRMKKIVCLLTLPLFMLSCAAPPVPVHHEKLEGEYFTAHSIRGEQSGDVKVVYPSNYLKFTDIFPAGSKVAIDMYSSRQIDLRIDDIPCRMVPRDADFATHPDALTRFIDKHFARTAPDMSGIDPSLKEQLDQGIAPIGSTKEEVLLGIGYPSHIDDTVPTHALERDRILKSNKWSYRYAEIMFVPVWHVYQFGTDGKLVNVIQ